MRDELWHHADTLLAYPGPEHRQELVGCLAALGPESRRRLAAFLQTLEGLSPSQWEELFVRTFDFAPATTLELGWHLYGEDYRRGEFLVVCRHILRRAGVAEKGELPDHASRLLPALARLPDEERAAFAQSYVLPALRSLAQALSARQNPYAHLLEALLAEAPAGVAGGCHDRT